MKEKLGRQDEEKARQVIGCELWRWIAAVVRYFPLFSWLVLNFCRSEVSQEISCRELLCVLLSGEWRGSNFTDGFVLSQGAVWICLPPVQQPDPARRSISQGNNRAVLCPCVSLFRTAVQGLRCCESTECNSDCKKLFCMQNAFLM